MGVADPPQRHETPLRLVIGPSWRAATSVLRVWPLPTTEGGEVEALSLAGEICLTPTGERRCTGRMDFEAGRRLPCPINSSITRGTQCDRCRIDEGFYLCLTCDGTDCPALPRAIERYCRQTHRLYLADFAAGKVKVGTAAESRGDNRLFEQAPIAAAYVASGPGPAIKRIERLASRAGLTEQMSRRRKGERVFAAGPDDVAARQRILTAYERLRTQLPAAPEMHEPQFVNLPARGSHETSVTAPRLPIKAGDTIRGSVISVRGGFVLLDVVGNTAVVDLGELRARVVDLTPRPATPPPAAQLQLF